VNSTHEMLIEYIDAWNRHDVAGILQFFGQDCRYEDEAMGKVMNGHAELRTFFEVMYQGFPDCHFEIVSVHAALPCVAWEWIMSGTHDGVGNNGLKPTGRQMRVRGASVTELRDGKIIANIDYWNVARMFRQLEGVEEI
jgi:steroid delta-isomerase-like uncharacterized protein